MDDTPLSMCMQVFSDRQTMLIQFLLSIFGTVGIVWAVYQYGIAPNWNGLLGILELLAWNAVGAFVALSIVGIVMLGLDTLFYWIQVKRHGSPVENVTDSRE